MKINYHAILIVSLAFMVSAQRATNPYTTPQSEGPNVMLPIGRNPTSVPPDDSVPTPRPRVNAGNDIVTGNVAGGREFRGALPYTPSTQLGAGLSDTGSADVRSFLRRSAGMPTTRSSIGQPYYDPSQTVTSIRRGELSGLSRPQVTFPGGSGRFSIPRLSEIEQMTQPQRPTWLETTEIEAAIQQQMGLRELALIKDQFKQLDPVQRDRLDPRIRELLDEFTEPEDRQIPRDRTFDESLQPVRPDKPADPQAISEVEQLRIQKDLFEQMRRDLEQLLESDVGIKPKPDPAGKIPLSDTPNSKTSTGRTVDATKTADTPPGTSTDSPNRISTKIDMARMRRLLGSHENFQSLAVAKSSEYAQQADEFMAKEQYYKAADNYTLAAIWRNDDPQIHLKKAFALLAAGSYLSSAQALQTAVILQPELAGEKSQTLAALLRKPMAETQYDKTTLGDNRMKEMGIWQERSDSGMLAFLMAYVYWQQNLPSKGRDALMIAEEKYPDDPAVLALRAVLRPEKKPAGDKP